MAATEKQPHVDLRLKPTEKHPFLGRTYRNNKENKTFLVVSAGASKVYGWETDETGVCWTWRTVTELESKVWKHEKHDTK